ncbi:MAG TPA: DUF4230 domain-containing protein [Thermomicrobiales bacterium]|nr:DUF4230 domain-containing protein [Thermomicrobiales bacterium]
MADPARQHHIQTAPVAPAAPARGGIVSTSCVTLLIAALLSVLLFVLLAGVAIGRIGSWFDLNPLGLFAEPDTQIHDRQPAVVLQMQSLARLETMNYTIEKVIEAEKSGNVFQDLLFGDRILLIAHGNVIAGVDLSALDDEDVEVNDDDALTVTLPPSEIFVATLNNEETRVYDRDQGLLSRGDAQLETRARQAAVAAILQAACDQGILEQAAAEAKTQLTALLGLLEFSAVTVIAPAGVCPAQE